MDPAVTVDWAELGKDSASVDYHIVAGSGAPDRLAVFAQLIEPLLPGTPDPRASGPAAAGEPWVTFGPVSRVPGLREAVSVCVTSRADAVDIAGRPFARSVLYRLPAAAFSPAQAGFTALWRTAKAAAEPVPGVALTVEPQAQPWEAVAAEIAADEAGFAWYATVAAALLERPLVITPASPMTADRAAWVLDMISCLLPAGLRGALDAATAIDGLTDHRLRLVFAAQATGTALRVHYPPQPAARLPAVRSDSAAPSGGASAGGRADRGGRAAGERAGERAGGRPGGADADVITTAGSRFAAPCPELGDLGRAYLQALYDVREQAAGSVPAVVRILRNLAEPHRFGPGDDESGWAVEALRRRNLIRGVLRDLVDAQGVLRRSPDGGLPADLCAPRLRREVRELLGRYALPVGLRPVLYAYAALGPFPDALPPVCWTDTAALDALAAVARARLAVGATGGPALDAEVDSETGPAAHSADQFVAAAPPAALDLLLLRLVRRGDPPGSPVLPFPPVADQPSWPAIRAGLARALPDWLAAGGARDADHGADSEHALGPSDAGKRPPAPGAAERCAWADRTDLPLTQDALAADLDLILWTVIAQTGRPAAARGVLRLAAGAGSVPALSARIGALLLGDPAPDSGLALAILDADTDTAADSALQPGLSELVLHAAFALGRIEAVLPAVWPALSAAAAGPQPRARSIQGTLGAVDSLRLAGPRALQIPASPGRLPPGAATVEVRLDTLSLLAAAASLDPDVDLDPALAPSPVPTPAPTPIPMPTVPIALPFGWHGADRIGPHGFDSAYLSALRELWADPVTGPHVGLIAASMVTAVAAVAAGPGPDETGTGASTNVRVDRRSALAAVAQVVGLDDDLSAPLEARLIELRMRGAFPVDELPERLWTGFGDRHRGLTDAYWIARLREAGTGAAAALIAGIWRPAADSGLPAAKLLEALGPWPRRSWAVRALTALTPGAAAVMDWCARADALIDRLAPSAADPAAAVRYQQELRTLLKTDAWGPRAAAAFTEYHRRAPAD